MKIDKSYIAQNALERPEYFGYSFEHAIIN
jgi:hypothetical protein